MAQMRACEGLIAQGRRRIAASQMRSQEISRSVEEVTLTLALPLAPSPSPSPSPSIQPTPEPNQVEEAYGEQSLEEELSGAEVLLLIRTLTLTTPSPSPKPDPKPDPNPRCGRALHAECMEKWLLRRNDCVFCQAWWS